MIIISSHSLNVCKIADKSELRTPEPVSRYYTKHLPANAQLLQLPKHLPANAQLLQLPRHPVAQHDLTPTEPAPETHSDLVPDEDVSLQVPGKDVSLQVPDENVSLQMPQNIGECVEEQVRLILNNY